MTNYQNYYSTFTVENWIKNAANKLRKSRCTNPELDAKILISHVMKVELNNLYVLENNALDTDKLNYLDKLLIRRMNGEPIAYILSYSEFWSLKLVVSKNTMIPRSDTEVLVEHALNNISLYDSGEILDLGTGTGAVALAIAKERPKCKLTGIDKNFKSIRIAKLNAKQLNIQNVKFLFSNWFNNIKEKKYNMIVSNPPYIDKYNSHLSSGDLRFEPKTALISGNNGTKDLSIIIKKSVSYLQKNGYMLVEHGNKQGKFVRYMLTSNGYKNVNTYVDYSGNERVSIGVRSS